MDKKKKEKQSDKSSRRTSLRQKQQSRPSGSLRSVETESVPTRKPRAKSTVPVKLGIDEARVGVDEVNAAPRREREPIPSTPRGLPQEKSPPPRKRKPYKKKYPNETPEERTLRRSLAVAKHRLKRKLEKARAAGFETIEDHKMFRRHKVQEALNRDEISAAKRRGAHSKLTLLRRAVVSLAKAIHAELEKPLEERGDFREIKFRYQHLANAMEII